MIYKLNKFSDMITKIDNHSTMIHKLIIMKSCFLNLFIIQSDLIILDNFNLIRLV